MAIAPTLVGDELLTAEQAADYLNVKPQTLALWRSTGRHGLPFVRVGRAIRYRRRDLEQWLADRTATSTGECV